MSLVVYTICINDVLLLALIDTGCNTMVFQSKYAVHENLQQNPSIKAIKFLLPQKDTKITVDK